MGSHGFSLDLDRGGIGFFGVDAIAANRLADHGDLDHALIDQGLEGGQGNKLAVDLKEGPQAFAHIGTAKAVGAEGDVTARAFLKSPLTPTPLPKGEGLFLPSLSGRTPE
ncbi:hypothetical protein CCP4SC76_5470017 [Gammaproteobacteria bacterium]